MSSYISKEEELKEYRKSLVEQGLDEQAIKDAIDKKREELERTY